MTFTRCYYYARVLDATGIGSIEVGNQFGLRIDAVDFADAPTGTGCLVPLALTAVPFVSGETEYVDIGRLYGPNGKDGEQIPVTVNGVATGQSLVYDAAKGGLVLYVPPAPAAIAWTLDANGDTITTYYDTTSTISDALLAFSNGEGVAIRFAEALPQGYHDALIAGNCTYDAETITYTKFTPVASITVGQTTHTYPTLSAAVSDAQDGNTVTLLTDVTLDARIEPNLGSGMALTIDLGGYTLSRTGTGGNGSVIDVKSGNVVITNGVIDCTQDDTAIVANGVYAITARSGANVTLDTLTVTVDSECGACVYPFDGATVTILGGAYANRTSTPYRYKTAWTGMAVNQANVSTQLITIYGGSFKQVDPTLGDDSWASAGNGFLASGYAATWNPSTGYYDVAEYVPPSGIDPTSDEGAPIAVDTSKTPEEQAED